MHTIADENRKLFFPLQPFHCTLSTIQHNWPTYYVPSTNLINCKKLAGVHILQHKLQREIIHITNSQQPPPESQPFYYSIKSHKTSCGHFTKQNTTTTNSTSTLNWENYINNRDALSAAILQPTKHYTTTKLQHIWKQLTTNSLIMATDGSVLNGRGTYGWVIVSTTGNRITKQSGHVYRYQPSSY